MKEIESKAWIFESDKKRVLDFLHNSEEITILNNGEKIIKKDVMYTKIGKNIVEFRLREELGKYWVTKKIRNYTKLETEVNSEIEFEVTSEIEFHTFVKMLGYTEMYTKEKMIHQFQYTKNTVKILIEYVKMSGLSQKGDLLEIEILCNDNATIKEIAEAEKNILDIFKILELENQVEPAPYGKLLGQF